MKPGPELDKLMGEQVMGWHLEGVRWCNADGQETGWKSITDWYTWRPSREIESAWEVLNHFGAWKLATLDDGFYCEIALQSATAPTAELAICLAAYQVVSSSTTARS